jgi:hypothetical protein
MFRKMLSLVAVLVFVASAQAAMLEITPTAPEPGAFDIANLVGCTTDANNVGTPDDPPYANDATTYVAMDRGGQGQTFATGSNELGYLVTGVWMKHVTYTGSTDQTWYRMQPGGVLQIRITNPAAAGTDGFVLSSETYTITGAEENALPSDTTNDQTGTGLWFHVTLDTPVLLAANTEYGFDLASLTGQAGILFFETDGIRDDAQGGNPYEAGTAYVSGAAGATDNNMTVAPGDHVFVVELSRKGPNVIYVTSVKDNNLDGVQDDISWKDWLEAEGCSVDFRPGYWSDPLDANEIAELNAADLIIASRGMATGDFDGAETPKWNGVTTPILCTNAWMIRNNRWKWMNSGTANKDAGSPLMLVSDPCHPIFAGLPVDEDGLIEVLDPNAGSGNTSFLTDFLDPGNGTLLSMSLGVYTTAWIVEWQPGVEYYAGAGEIAAGRRMLFMAGTQDDPYTDANGNIMPVGVFNLNENGQQLLRNIMAYMTRPTEIAVENASFEMPQTKCQLWDGGTNSKGTFEDVPGWSSDTMADDSGIEGPDAWPGHTDGVMAGYMMGTDPSVWNTTSYIIGEGEKFTLSVDARDNWTSDPALPAKLAMTLYCDIGGVRLPLAATTVELTTTWTTFTLKMTADALAAGLPIGIELKNASNATTDNNSWIGIDNVHLTVP